MLQRTIVLSDLHLGSGGDFETFAGADALPALLDKLGSDPVRVIVNGDGVDFLKNEDPLELSPARALSQAAASFESTVTGSMLHAFGRVVARGGELVMRLGNHDIELALEEVQDLFRRSLGQGPQVATRVRFERGDQPGILTAGGARILVTHGEENDGWNKVDYAHLPGPGGPSGVRPESFTYSPGSRLVKTLMNPLKRRYGMHFADLLKPDFQGATLTALAVNPLAVKVIFQGSTLELMWQLFQKRSGPATFLAGEGDENLGLYQAIERTGLTAEEMARLQTLLGDEAALSFSSDESDSVLDRARLKLAQAGLGYYARMQKSLVKDSADNSFDLTPEDNEWHESQRLAQKFDAAAVVLGHTHAARFKSEGPLTYVNTGTWIWQMRLPAVDASDAEWTGFLELCQSNPRLDPQKGKTVPLVQRFTGALIDAKGPDPTQGGATLSLFQWGPSGLEVLGETHLTAGAAGPSRP
jgi:UDP-2,3-diacylglucosamine pyrophosphatase LpxH